MKNKKAFTLIELLGVIILLGIIALIVIPTINFTTEGTKEKLKEKQIESIITAAKRYSNEFMDDIQESEYYHYVSLNKLKTEGYLKTDETLNPVTREVMNGCVLATYEHTIKQYNFEYFERSCDTLGEIVPKENLLQNTSFLNDTEGWSLGVNVTRDEEVKYGDCISIKSTQTGLSTSQYRGITQIYQNVVAGERYTVSGYAKTLNFSQIDTNVAINIHVLNNSNTILSNISKIFVLDKNEVWIPNDLTFTIPTGGTSLRVMYFINRNGTAWFACPKLEKNTIATIYMP